MSVWDRISGIVSGQEESARSCAFLQLLGPISLFGALFLAPSLAPAGAIGFILSSYFRMRGFAYSLVLLGVFAFAEHGFFSQNHAWQFGLEAVLGCSFWITALAQEEGAQCSTSLSAQISEMQESLRVCKENLDKEGFAYKEKQRAAEAEIAALLTRIEEESKERVSILILNEVLRKTTACHIEEKMELEKQSIDLQRKISAQRDEISRYEKGRPDRDELMKELNAARIEREQTHLINETLARLHAQKCRELEEVLANPKVEVLTVPTQTELLYHQLRRQFDEKNQILHETRKDLFRKETELEALLIDKEQKASLPDPLVDSIQREIESISQESAILKEENLHLQEIISLLTSQIKPPSVKKKVKKKSASALEGALHLF